MNSVKNITLVSRYFK